ncbi:MAG: hypothetical protein WCI54_08245 [Bacteroidia bacterium]|jgi:hypothetical protein
MTRIFFYIGILLIFNTSLFVQALARLMTTAKGVQIKVIVENCGGIDGLGKMKVGNFVYSNREGRIFNTKGTESIKLLDMIGKKSSADLDFVPGKNLILDPTFTANRVEAYQLNTQVFQLK